MVDVVQSRMGVPIRLTDERWAHIVDNHDELAGLRGEVLRTVENPGRIVAGGAGELLGTREYQPGKWLVVAYREFNGDGFIITAFLTSRMGSLERRTQLWP
jgi:hypothetical protein